jgi:hypothetical protein
MNRPRLCLPFDSCIYAFAECKCVSAASRLKRGVHPCCDQRRFIGEPVSVIDWFALR